MKKKSIPHYIVLLAMLATTISIAHPLDNGLGKKNFKKTTLTLTNVKQGNQLLIKDSRGVVVYKEIISSNGTYSKRFDLTALPDGSYVFELNKDVEIKSIPFKVDSKQVVLHESESTIFKPYVSNKDNYVYVTKLALNKEPLDVKIYYGDEELIYSEKIKNTKTIEKIYKLSESIKGRYKIVLTSNGREYHQYISI